MWESNYAYLKDLYVKDENNSNQLVHKDSPQDYLVTVSIDPDREDGSALLKASHLTGAASASAKTDFGFSLEDIQAAEAVAQEQEEDNIKV